GLRVQAEPVERMARVGDLLAAVCAPGRSEKRLLQAGTSDGLPVRDQRRPEGRALSVAGDASVLVLLEQVERATLAVDDDAAQPRARDADLARTGATAGARRGSRAVRACGIRRAACGAAAAGGDQDGRQGRCEGDEHCDL